MGFLHRTFQILVRQCSRAELHLSLNAEMHSNKMQITLKGPLQHAGVQHKCRSVRLFVVNSSHVVPCGLDKHARVTISWNIRLAIFKAADAALSFLTDVLCCTRGPPQPNTEELYQPIQSRRVCKCTSVSNPRSKLDLLEDTRPESH